MSSILDFIRPAQVVQEINDPDQVKKQYRYWRIRIFYAMYLGYVFYYFSRKSLVFAMPLMIQHLGMNKAQLGILTSVMGITYGLSKFVSGILSDKSNPRFFMAAGLVITGVLNIFFGMSSTVLWFAIFWGLNGWFQGFGWPPCSKLLSHWYSKSERGTWWSFWSTSHNIWAALLPFIAVWSAQTLGWRYTMFVPGAICILAGLFLINRLRDTPQSLGLPNIEKHRKETAYTEQETKQMDRQLSFKEILFKYVLNNGYIWILALCSIFIYVIRTALNDWITIFLMETRNFGHLSASSCVLWFEIGGGVGMLVAGWLSDKVWGGRRGPANAVFAFGMFVCLTIFWFFPQPSLLWNSIIVSLIGFFLFGPQMLIGLAAAELSHKNATGTATGFAGWFAYLGAAIAGYPLGVAIEKFGWQGFFVMIVACGFLATISFLPLWSAGSKKAKQSSSDDVQTQAS